MAVLITITALLFAVVLHEFAHGWVAFKRGDQTAKLAGRLTLNPLKHIDPIGTLVVPLALKLLGLTPIGWAKPVPVNFTQLKNPRQDMALVAAAGPAVNFLLAFVSGTILKSDLLELLPRNIAAYIFVFLVYVVYINLLLGVFNLIPLPPLDGSRIMMAVLPRPLAMIYHRLEPYGTLILIVLLNLGILDFVGNIVHALFYRINAPLMPS